AEETPNNIAVVFENNELSYKELNEKANQLAHYLLKFDDVSQGDIIGISIERSELLIVALLGVLKAGFAYVLIDTSLPSERFNYILSDSGCQVLINDSFLEKFKNELIKEPTDKPNIRIALDDVVYLMYTSGSTGMPKGAINIYKGFTNTVKWYAEKIGKTDKIGVISNLSFDLTQKNYFAPLIVGACVCIDSEFHPVNTRNFIKNNKITIINCAPTLFYNLLDENQADLACLDKVILGGESIKLELIKEFLKEYNVALFNSYGPSEASDVSTEYHFKNEDIDSIPIGKPIRNTKIFILDRNSKQVPIGAIGEICIGGIGVGLGYLNNPVLTAEKFVVNPFMEGGIMYKTGDLGFWLADGNIKFL
ncbi:AMP-binding protein, partial [Flavobacterium sp. Leaf82]|uniref:AMP-binding protein n=2 Tax=unclassified Flavobacterium TaxID=196869 RepID=UPI000B2E61F2